MLRCCVTGCFGVVTSGGLVLWGRGGGGVLSGSGGILVTVVSASDSPNHIPLH